MSGHGNAAQSKSSSFSSNRSAILAGVTSGQIPVYSSTPFLNIGGGGVDLKQLKQTMKLPLVPPGGSTSMEEIMNQSAGGGGGNSSHPHITFRDRYNHTSGLGNSLISPIVNANGKPRGNVLLTEQRANRSKGYGASDSGGGDSSSNLYAMYSENMLTEESEPGEILCRMLKMIGLLLKIEAEMERLEVGKIKKEKAIVEEMQVPIEFEEDTFIGVNSEAANQALYMIFSAIDGPETENRFRHCWPVYEKKLEGVFRRAVLEWTKKLVDENPVFFSDLKPEAIGGLLVNPGGDRFIAFLRMLCRYAIYVIVDKKKGLLKQQMLYPPVSDADSEISSRQIHLLEARQRQNYQEARDTWTRMLKVDIATERALRETEEKLEELKVKQDEEYEAVLDIVRDNPDVFGEVTEEELEEREEILEGFKLQQFLQMMSLNESPPDFLRERLESVVKRRTEEIYKSVSQLEDVIQDYSKIWHILEMDKSQPRVLNCTKLLAHLKQEDDDSELPSCTDYIQSLVSSVQDLTRSAPLNEPVPDEVLIDFDSILKQVTFQEIMMAEIDKNMNCDKEQQAQDRIEMLRKIPLLRQKLDGFDWCQISGVPQRGVVHLVDVSPRKTYDMNKATGRTPGINEFLESSSSSSSTEQLTSTAIVKRRSARRSEPLRRRISDTVDGMKPAKSCLLETNATPLSSSTNKSSEFCNSLLFQESSMATPMSAFSSKSSFRMRKSVSFDSTSTPLNSYGDSSISMRHRSSTRLSIGPFSPASPSMFASPGISLLEASSRLSIASSISNLDVSTQERLKKLMEACNHASPQQNTSLSPIASSEGGGDNDPAETTTTSQGGAGGDLDSTTREVTFAELMNVSLREDFEQLKGIMETSYCEMQLRNSDSDD